MVELYTPTAAWGTDPVSIQEAGEFMDAALAFIPVKTALDRTALLKDNLDETTGRFDACLIKLGLTVTGPSDTTLPTYGGSPYLLTGNKSYQTALETLDGGLQTQNTIIVNTYTNVGGNVHTGSPDNYSSTVYLVNGDTHHVALGKLDAGLDTVNTAASSANAQATANSSRVTNVVTKLGANADQGAAWAYASINYIQDGQTLKVNTETIDANMLGAKRTAHTAFGEASKQALRLTTLEETLTNAEVFWDDLYDSTKVDGANTTATVDNAQQQATGDSTVLVEQFTATTTQDQIQIHWESYGSVTVYANFIGSVTPGDYTQITTQDTWYDPASGDGTGVVIKFEIGVGGKLYNHYALTKP